MEQSPLRTLLAIGVPGLVEDPVAAHRVVVTTDILGVDTNVPLQDDGTTTSILKTWTKGTGLWPRQKTGC